MIAAAPGDNLSLGTWKTYPRLTHESTAISQLLAIQQKGVT